MKTWASVEWSIVSNFVIGIVISTDFGCRFRMPISQTTRAEKGIQIASKSPLLLPNEFHFYLIFILFSFYFHYIFITFSFYFHCIFVWFIWPGSRCTDAERREGNATDPPRTQPSMIWMNIKSNSWRHNRIDFNRFPFLSFSLSFFLSLFLAVCLSVCLSVCLLHSLSRSLFSSLGFVSRKW